jgi:pimeloyl-ACP methyl ester carboxylesterase
VALFVAVILEAGEKVLLRSYERPLKYAGEKQPAGSVVKKYININGARQGLIIESSNKGNPLLLFLHGGPGFPVYPIIKSHRLKLEKYFDVCYWDQRGTGMSYNAEEAKNPLTLKQLLDDTIQVVHYLRETYTQEKVYLLGHSWGTFLGSLAAGKYPELFHAYIGIGQIGSALESEKESYHFILNKAIHKGDRKAQKQIEKVQFDDTYYKNRSYGEIKSKYTNMYGGGFKRRGYSNLEILKDILGCPNYTFQEKINIFRGSLYAWQSLGELMATRDLVQLVPSLDLPVFIIHGEHDYNTTWTQANRFYESVRSPYKKMYTFSHSAHSPFIEEQERFFEIIEKDILEAD